MGKLKTKSKGKRKRNKRSTISASLGDEKSAGQPKTNDSKLIEKLLEQADSCINKFEFDLAQKFLERVLEYQPDNISALESLAGVFLELGNPEQASNILLKAVEVCPDTRHSIYFSLGQLNEGKKALEYYRKGVDIIERLLQNGISEIEKNEGKVPVRRDISNAYCAMGEIYMTDCCFEDDAEEHCKSCIDKSIEYDSSNPESYQSLSNFLLVKGNKEEAKQTIEKSLSLWLPQYQAVVEGNLDCDLSSPLQLCPLDYDTRISTSKILIELEIFEEASDILNGLIDEDDEVTEVWYLLGWMNYLRGEIYWGNARFYFRKAIEVEAKIKAGDPDQICHAKEILNELGNDDDTEENSVRDENLQVEAEISDSELEDMES